MSIENNLFSFATKELSQDAIIAWLINKSCVNGTDKTGRNFFCNLMGWETSENFEITNVIRQYKSIDVFVEIEKDDGKEAIIIEDKTDTFLHDFQMLKYIGKIAEEKKFKYNKIHFVLVKTGAIPELEEDKFDFEKDLIYKIREKNNAEILDEIRKRNFAEINASYNLRLSKETVDEKTLNSIRKYSKENDKTIEVHAIYKNYIEYVSSLNATSQDKILEHYQEYINKQNCNNDAQSWLDENYRKLCKVLKKDENMSYYFDKAQSSGGSRGYECRIVCKEFIKCENNAESLNENYCILPIICFGDSEIVFQVNYSLIADKDAVNGYVPLDKINDSELKRKYIDYKEYTLSSEIEKKYSAYKTRKSKNRLCFMKWKIEYESGKSIDFEKEIERMIEFGEFIKKSITNYKS